VGALQGFGLWPIRGQVKVRKQHLIAPQTRAFGELWFFNFND
jgi:hypothetical protein